MLEYEFFRNALIGVVLVSALSALIGTYIVARRLVAISGGVTHACFGGLGLGCYLGFSPVILAGGFAVVSSLAVDWLQRTRGVRSDTAIAVIWGLGMALGVLFVFLTPGYVPELNAFLFGNILTVTRTDLWIFAGFTFLVAAGFVIFYRQIIMAAFDPDFFRVRKLKVTLINTLMTIIVALTIVLVIRLVGVMLLMSMVALPAMIGEMLAKRYSSVTWVAIVSSVCASVGGLYLATIINVPASALIVLTLLGTYIIVSAFVKIGTIRIFSKHQKI